MYDSACDTGESNTIVSYLYSRNQLLFDKFLSSNAGIEEIFRVFTVDWTIYENYTECTRLKYKHRCVSAELFYA